MEEKSAVISVNLNKPMKLATFKTLSIATRKEYIQNIFSRYPKLDTNSLALMFGTTTKWIKTELAELGITPPNASGKIANESREKFKKEMLNQNSALPVKETASEPAPEPAPKPAPKPISAPASVHSNKKEKVVIDYSNIVIRAKNLKPITYEQSKYLKAEEKTEYFKKIFQKYPGLTLTAIAEMLDVSKITVSRLFKELEIDVNNFYYPIPVMLESRKNFCLDMLGREMTEAEEITCKSLRRSTEISSAKKSKRNIFVEPDQTAEAKVETKANTEDIKDEKPVLHSSNVENESTLKVYNLDIEIVGKDLHNLIMALGLKDKKIKVSISVLEDKEDTI